MKLNYTRFSDKIKGMKLIIALGNPGPHYQYNRHNAGWLVLDMLTADLKLTDKWKKQFQSEIMETSIDGQKVILVKPQTFMNDSGLAVKELVKYYKLNLSTDIVVLHDDVDLPFGTIRATDSSSSAGQNGVQNIIDELGTQDFHRIRIGVETRESREQMGTRDFVLQNFAPNELEKLKNEAFPKIKTEVERFIKIPA
jgi:PTH1 family peptidyl-tRNA hydrolase